jgi:hypothetical protein
MSRVKLNTDLLYEIFSHFVAIDPDGPFTLILVCTTWREMVLKLHPLWSWINLDDELGDLEARVTICARLSASHPLNLILYVPISPSLVQIIRPYVHRVQSVLANCPVVVDMDVAVAHVSNLIRKLHLHHALFRFFRDGKDTPYCPYKIFENQSLDPLTCPSNIITAFVLHGRAPQFSLHRLLMWLSSNIHLTCMDINFDLFEAEQIRCAQL